MCLQTMPSNASTGNPVTDLSVQLGITSKYAAVRWYQRRQEQLLGIFGIIIWAKLLSTRRSANSQ